MKCFLDKCAQVEPHFVGVRLLPPVFEVALVDAPSGEEIYDIHEELLVGVFHLGNDGDFLTLCAALEKKFGGIMGIVWRQKGHHVLAHGVGSWASICPHHLVEDVIDCHQRIPSHGGQSIGGSNFERIVNVHIKRVVHSTIYVACCVVVVLLVLEGRHDTQRFLAREGDNRAVVGLRFREFWYSGIVWDVK